MNLLVSRIPETQRHLQGSHSYIFLRKSQTRCMDDISTKRFEKKWMREEDVKMNEWSSGLPSRSSRHGIKMNCSMYFSIIFQYGLNEDLQRLNGRPRVRMHLGLESFKFVRVLPEIPPFFGGSWKVEFSFIVTPLKRSSCPSIRKAEKKTFDRSWKQMRINQSGSHIGDQEMRGGNDRTKKIKKTGRRMQGSFDD